ncbi:hypothetical protein [Deinococcus sp. UYEF24]
MGSFQRIPLKPGAEPYEAVAYCDNQDWRLLAKHGDKNFLHYIFDSGGGQVHVMWDHAAKKYFFTLIGKGRKKIGENIYDLGASAHNPLDVCTYEEAISLATKLDDPADIYYACLISNDTYDKNILRCYEKAFSSEIDDVRFYACASCSYFVDWEDKIKPLLIQVRDNDSDGSVREIAKSTLISLEKNDWNRGNQILDMDIKSEI